MQLKRTGLIWKQRKAAIIVGMVLLVVCLAFGLRAPKEITRGTISMENLNKIEIQDLLNEKAENSNIRIFINSNIVAERSDSPANLLIQNFESNQSSCKIIIRRNDTGACIYQSDEIPAGYKVETARLQQTLPAGSYPCTAEFHILAQDGTEKCVVNVGVQISILR